MKSRETLKVVSEPSLEPIGVSELRSRLRIADCEFDGELRDLLIAGRKQVEHDSDRKLITQTVQLLLDRFPTGNVIELRVPPVSSLTSITYIDEDDAEQTLSSDVYHLDLSSTPPRVVLRSGESWETVDDGRPNAVTVEFVAGYGNADTVPVEAKLAIVEWVRMHWGSCDGDGAKYANLLNSLRWTGYLREGVVA